MVRRALPVEEFRVVRVAIVGAGISGLVAAHRLHRDHEVEVFEASSWIGGHTHTVSVELGDREYEVDTGFIVYNEQNYPHFTSLLRELQVETDPTVMSFGLRSERSGVEYNGDSLAGLFAKPSNLLRPSYLRMLAEVPRFYRAGNELLTQGDRDPSLGEWLDEHRFSRTFCEEHVLPMAGAIWSAEPRLLRDFPARSLLQFFANHGLLSLGERPQWRVIRGGSHRYVEALTRSFREQIRTETAVRRILREPDGVTVESRRGAERFDAVVMACHSDQALSLLADPTGTEAALLGAIRYQPNEVVLHTDERLLPRSRRARAAWNYLVPTSASDLVTVTYDMNRLQHIDSAEPLLVTLNQTAAIDPDRVLGRWQYAHPLFDGAAIEAQAGIEKIQGARRTFYAGAWCGYGFHEDGVRSGLSAVDALRKQLG